MSQHISTCRACGKVCADHSTALCETCRKDCFAIIGAHCPACQRITKASPGSFGSLKLECGHDLILLTNDVWLCRKSPSIKSKMHSPPKLTIVQSDQPKPVQVNFWDENDPLC